jgi:hypothetical protein
MMPHPDAAMGTSASATGSPNVWTTRWIRRSTSASREPSSDTARDVSQSVVNAPLDHLARPPRSTTRLTIPRPPIETPTVMDVRIHDLLVRAALVSPSRVGATIGDEARTFAELDAGRTARTG